MGEFALSDYPLIHVAGVRGSASRPPVSSSRISLQPPQKCNTPQHLKRSHAHLQHSPVRSKGSREAPGRENWSTRSCPCGEAWFLAKRVVQGRCLIICLNEMNRLGLLWYLGMVNWGRRAKLGWCSTEL